MISYFICLIRLKKYQWSTYLALLYWSNNTRKITLIMYDFWQYYIHLKQLIILAKTSINGLIMCEFWFCYPMNLTEHLTLKLFSEWAEKLLWKKFDRPLIIPAMYFVTCTNFLFLWWKQNKMDVLADDHTRTLITTWLENWKPVC